MGLRVGQAEDRQAEDRLLPIPRSRGDLVSIKCRRCGRTDFRLSRFHPFDLKRLAILQYPVRCRSCHHRRFTSLLGALKVAGEAKPAPRGSRTAEKAENAVPHTCIRCGREGLRLSRIHRFDLRHLLKLQHPVRCEACRDRAYTSIWNAIGLRSEGKTPGRVRKAPSMARSAGPYV